MPHYLFSPVCIRIRPNSESGERFLTQGPDNANTILVNSNGSEAEYNFDSVYGESSSTKQIYNDYVKDVVDLTLQGRNSAVFAYGQTAT
jgi:hypothetical protein